MGAQNDGQPARLRGAGRQRGVVLGALLYTVVVLALIPLSEVPLRPAALARTPATVALVHAALGQGQALVLFQGLLYAAGILALAHAAVRQVRGRWARGLTVGGLLLLGLTPELLSWCRAPGAESLSLSLLLLLLAQVTPRLSGLLRDGPLPPPPPPPRPPPLLSRSGTIDNRGAAAAPAIDNRGAAAALAIDNRGATAALAIERGVGESRETPAAPPPRPALPGEDPRWLQLTRRGLFVLTALAWGLCGDAHAPWLLVLTLLCPLLALVGSGPDDTRRSLRVALPVLGFVAVLCAASYTDAQLAQPQGARWALPTGQALTREPPAQRAYLRSLLANPAEALLAPLRRADSLLWGKGLVLPASEGPPPAWQAALGVRLNRFGRGALFALMLALALLGHAAIGGRMDRRFLLPLALLLSVYPAMLVVYHQDALEHLGSSTAVVDLQQRALPVLLALRLGLLLLLGLGLSSAHSEDPADDGAGATPAPGRS